MASTTIAGPLANASLSTIVLYVNDLESMTAFYRDTLGLRVRVQTESYVELAAGSGADIALHAGQAPAAIERHWFIEFRVDDIEAAVEALRARGVDVGAISERWWGKEAAFADPEGNRIELEQPSPDGQPA